ncbi:MAG: hypothetical protein WC307_02960 [Candidatus Nanoarchaeia archaeon]|jgi:acetyltransferase-like isoleucine patch superfamily enzyme
MDKLLNAINKTISRLGFEESFVYLKQNKYISNIGLSLSPEEMTCKQFIGDLKSVDLESLINKGALTAEFYHHDYSPEAIIKPNGTWTLLKHRVRAEIAGVLPFIKLKNKLYSSMGVRVNGEPTVSPKVFMDYLNPSLIYLGDGAVIGEAAKLQAHFYNAGKYIIGEIMVGERATIGAGARLLPGTVICNDCVVGVDSTVMGYLSAGKHVLPNSFYKNF